MKKSASPNLLDECNRTRLIGELSQVLGQDQVPNDVGEAGRTLIGWLARRRTQDQSLTAPAQLRKSKRSRR